MVVDTPGNDELVKEAHVWNINNANRRGVNDLSDCVRYGVMAHSWDFSVDGFQVTADDKASFEEEALETEKYFLDPIYTKDEQALILQMKRFNQRKVDVRNGWNQELLSWGDEMRDTYGVDGVIGGEPL